MERGVNWIDTAAAYGLGHEEIVGQLLRRVPASRRPLVFTKGSLVWDHESRKISHCLAPDSLAREIDASLRRLPGRASTCTRSTGRPSRPTADEGIEAALSVLDRARQQERSAPSVSRTLA